MRFNIWRQYHAAGLFSKELDHASSSASVKETRIFFKAERGVCQENRPRDTLLPGYRGDKRAGNCGFAAEDDKLFGFDRRNEFNRYLDDILLVAGQHERRL